jgi:hypothetical protein
MCFILSNFSQTWSNIRLVKSLSTSKFVYICDSLPKEDLTKEIFSQSILQNGSHKGDTYKECAVLTKILS